MRPLRAVEVGVAVAVHWVAVQLVALEDLSIKLILLLQIITPL
jgi:hypothetical protein